VRFHSEKEVAHAFDLVGEWATDANTMGKDMTPFICKATFPYFGIQAI
jgi:hypothetical protein